MKKVVINTCHGGFSLSIDALLELFQRGFPLREFDLEGSPFQAEDFSRNCGEGVRANECFGVLLQGSRCYSAANVENDAALRSHPLLVQVVESLGERADGDFAALKVVTLDAEDYCIKEEDGLEEVVVWEATC